MKIFTIEKQNIKTTAKVETHTLKSGIKIPVVGVGEYGRGRAFAFLAVSLLPESQEKWENDGSVLISNVAIGKTRLGHPKLIEIETTTNNNEKIIIAVLNTSIGFRGSNSHTGDWDNTISYEGESEPKARHCHPFPGEILCEGTIAQGAAGNMGSGKQLIAVFKNDDVFRVGLGGRLYGAPGAYYYKVDTTTDKTDEVITVATWNERKMAGDMLF